MKQNSMHTQQHNDNGVIEIFFGACKSIRLPNLNEIIDDALIACIRYIHFFFSFEWKLG